MSYVANHLTGADTIRTLADRMNEMMDVLQGLNPQLKTKSWVATDGQTVFTIDNGSYDVGTGRLMMFVVGGVLQSLSQGNYLESSSTTITTSEPVSLGTIVDATWVEVGNPLINIDRHAGNHYANGADPIDITQLQNYGVDVKNRIDNIVTEVGDTTKIVSGSLVGDIVQNSNQIGTLSNNLVNVESYPKIAPEVDDAPRVGRAIASLGTAGGLVIFKIANYTFNTKVSVPSNVNLLGAGPLATKMLAGNNNMTVLDMGGSLRASISQMWVDGAGKTGVTAINIGGTNTNPTLHGKVEFVWIDSCATGIQGGWVYFFKLDTIRINGTTNGMSLTAGSNVITLINCAFFCTSTGLTWNNSSGLAVVGCMFESYSTISLFTCQGASIEGCYFENMGGTAGRWIQLGNISGGSADGISIKGNLFNQGATYGISLYACSGLEIEGNYFKTSTAAFEVDQTSTDTAPKRDIKIGVNTYNINALGYDPTKVFAYTGATTDSLNTNINMDQVQPILFNTQNEPQPSTINNSQGAAFFDGSNLFIKKKNSSGTVIKRQLDPDYGAATLPANTTSVVVNHNLGVTPTAVLISPNSSGMSGWWVDTAGPNSFTFHLPAGIASNTYFYWEAKV